MLCQDVMKSVVYTCREEDTASRCAEIMRDRNLGFVPVVDRENKLCGVVTDRDLAIRVVADKKTHRTKLAKIMSTDIVTCSPLDDLRDAEVKLEKTKKSRIVVVDDRYRVVGVISLSDVGRVEDTSRAGQVFHSITTRESRDLHRPTA